MCTRTDEQIAMDAGYCSTDQNSATYPIFPILVRPFVIFIILGIKWSFPPNFDCFMQIYENWISTSIWLPNHGLLNSSVLYFSNETTTLEVLFFLIVLLFDIALQVFMFLSSCMLTVDIIWRLCYWNSVPNSNFCFVLAHF